MKQTKKAQFLELDILFAILILVAGVFLLKSSFISTVDTPQLNQHADDLAVFLTSHRVGSLDNDFLVSLQDEIDIEDLDIILDPSISIARQAIILYLEAHSNNFHTDLIEESLKLFEQGTILSVSDFEVSFLSGQERIVLYNSTELDMEQTDFLARSRQFLTGLEIDKPFQGYTGSLFLYTQKSKKAAYAYLGGFVGQGNISVTLEIPDEFETIESFTLEGTFLQSFEVYVNNTHCHTVNPVSDGVTTVIFPSICRDLLSQGYNHIHINFTSADLSKQYVGGGFFTVEYVIDDQARAGTKALSSITETHYIPGVSGLFNIYDSFYVPGELQNMEVFLEFSVEADDSNSTAFFTLGNWTIFEQNVSNIYEARSIISHSDLQVYGVDYEVLSNQTVPYRFGFLNTTSVTQVTRPVDAIVITDLSGSMAWRFNNNYQGDTVEDCESPNILLLSTRRISVAKCVSKNFSQTILSENPLSRIGLVSYGTEVIDFHTHGLTSNQEYLEDAINNFPNSPGGWTNICDGIYEAQDMFLDEFDNKIDWNNQWRYNDSYLTGNMPPDINNRNWYHNNFDDLTWTTNVAVFGVDKNLNLGELITTNMSSRNKPRIHPNMYENNADRSTMLVEFDNTPLFGSSYSMAGANGWVNTNNYNINVFGYSNRIATASYNEPSRVLRLPFNNGIINSSGAWALTINVTQELYELYAQTNNLTIQIHYDVSVLANTDQTRLWVKASVTNESGHTTYLGENLDSQDTQGDDSFELNYFNESTTIRSSHVYTQNVFGLLNGLGLYFFEFGVKIQGHPLTTDYRGQVDLYMIGLDPDQEPDHYYFRNTFNAEDYNEDYHYYVSLMADNEADIYINGNYVATYSVNEYLDPAYNIGSNWDAYIPIPSEYIQEGQNFVAVQLRNNHAEARFDMQINYVNSTRGRAIIVMSDGEANRLTGCQGYGRAQNKDGIRQTYSTSTSNSDYAMDHTIYAACNARARTGALIYAVMFGPETYLSNRTMHLTAACDDPDNYFSGRDPEALFSIYDNIAQDILQSSVYEGQVISTSLIHSSVLSNESYVEYTYMPYTPPTLSGQLLLPGQLEPFDEYCNASVVFPSRLTPLEGRVASYSGPLWSHRLEVNDKEVFNLSRYNMNYTQLGDPFMIHIPRDYLRSGQNNITLGIGAQASSPRDCSPDSKFLFLAALNSTIVLDQVYPESTGCNWTVDVGPNNQTFSIPSDYTGSQLCYYGRTSPDVDVSCSFYTNTSNENTTQWSANPDLWSQLGKELFATLDLNSDCIVDIDLEVDDIGFRSTDVGGIPYLWGPSVLEVTVWR